MARGFVQYILLIDEFNFSLFIDQEVNNSSNCSEKSGDCGSV